MTESPYDLAKPGAGARLSKSSLLLHDGFVFLSLLLITGALYGVTFFLFRSFESRREDMAHRWAARGEHALQQDQPAAAVVALRAALSYAPDEHSYQLLLAEALANDGRTEEANNYFLNLWSARPGDGFVNLQLARLALKRKEPQEAIDYYRAAVYGDWHGDGLQRRRSTRLELADFLVQKQQLPAARTEYLIAAGNAPDNAELNLLIGDKLDSIGDPADAMTLYQRAITDQPKSYLALARAGITAYQLGDYDTARSLLNRAQHQKSTGATAADQALRSQVATLAANADRLLQLSMSRDLPARERARHIRLASTIALARLKSCVAMATLPEAPPALPVLTGRWAAAMSTDSQAQLASNADVQDSMMQLIYDTELQTTAVCRPPGPGDDALLLRMAQDKRAANSAASMDSGAGSGGGGGEQ